MKSLALTMLVWLAALPLAAAVKLAGEPILTVAADANTAAGVIRLHNDDAGKDVTDALLELDDFVNSEGVRLATVRKIGTLTTAPAASYLKVTIPKGGDLQLSIEVANLREPGYSKAGLRIGDTPVGTIHALKDRFAFNVAPAGWKGDAPLAVQTADDGSFHIDLKNSDPFVYLVGSKIADEGRTLKDEPIRLSDNGAVRIEAKDSRGKLGLAERIGGFFKNPQTDATLTLSALPRPGDLSKAAFTSRLVPLRIEHVLYGNALRGLVSTLIVLGVLLLGALASLYVTYSIPNRLRRLNVKEAIEAPSSGIRRLSVAIFSTLRTGLRVERMRLLARLKSRWALSPDFATMAADCENGAKLLDRQVKMLSRADLIYRRIDELWQSTGTYGPTVLRQSCGLLQEAQQNVDLPEVSEAELQIAEAKVTAAEGLIAAAPVLDQAFAEALAARVAASNKRFAGSLKGNKTLSDFLSEVKELDAAVDVQFANAANINAANVSAVDFAVAKIGLLMDFLEAYELGDPMVKTKCEPTRARLLGALRMHSFPEFRRAEGFVAQMREQVYSFELHDALSQGNARIEWEPQRPKVNQSVDYTITLLNQRYNAAAARKCFTCHWDFGDQWRPEKGWKVSHYFSSPGERTVRVTFTDDEGEPIVDSTGTPVKIEQKIVADGSPARRWGERSKIEAIQLAIIVLVACAALLAGANDSLAKVDLLPGLIAVFALGFSADQVKNAIAGRK